MRKSQPLTPGVRLLPGPTVGFFVCSVRVYYCVTGSVYLSQRTCVVAVATSPHHVSERLMVDVSFLPLLIPSHVAKLLLIGHRNSSTLYHTLKVLETGRHFLELFKHSIDPCFTPHRTLYYTSEGGFYAFISTLLSPMWCWQSIEYQHLLCLWS